jgi:hypothetical protein
MDVGAQDGKPVDLFGPEEENNMRLVNKTMAQSGLRSICKPHAKVSLASHSAASPPGQL